MPDPKDDIGFDEYGRPIAIGQEAQDRQTAIVEDPAATPVLVVARLGDEIGVRCYGPPSHEVAAILDQVARTYRQAVVAAAQRKS
jgi:hypothetical protein